MKIAFLSVWYSEGMGYIENCLPKAIASYGHEVHVITSTAQVYYNDPDYEQTYKPYLGNKVMDSGIKKTDGFSLHRLDFGTFQEKIYLKKIGKKLKEINPDVVQVFDAFSFLTLQGAFFKSIVKYKFFTANHTVASVFPLLNGGDQNITSRINFFFTRSIPGRIISFFTSRCYPATIDAQKIAIDYYKVQKHKVHLTTLGVDTDLFHPLSGTEAEKSRIHEARTSLHISKYEILCIYTGRFTPGKNPLCLAKAIEKLVQLKEPFKALFMGDGPQADEIRKTEGCIVHEFVPFHELPDFYHMADIGVWPRQESTSMLDAVACGLPIIISNRVQAVERIEGNGLTYDENNVDDLVRVLLEMKDEKVRQAFSDFGIEKIRKNFSWLKLAGDRIKDYQDFI